MKTTRCDYQVGQLLLLSCMLVISTGCLIPQTRVVRQPDDSFDGVRFYRPKPHLLIKPIPKQQGKVEISLHYLPDFTEDYGIKIRSGLGINNTKIELDKGWQLTSLNANLDSQFDENVKAIGNAIGTAVTAGADSSNPAGAAEPKIQCRARNVPLGFYEAILGRDSCGKRRLYGWRYLGFAPFHPCPTLVTGGPECASCETSLDLWGLVPSPDGLEFRRIGELGSRSEDGTQVGPPATAPEAEPPAQTP